MILLAVVDYRYRFMYTNIGAPGRCNDSQLYEDSSLKKFVLENFDKKIQCISGVDVPVYLIGDSAFRLSKNMMKPYPYGLERNDAERHFNYSLSKCRRLVENAFGQVKARFRRIGRGLEGTIENATIIIQASCILHNVLNESNDAINNRWMEEMAQLGSLAQPSQDVLFDILNDGHVIRDAVAQFLSKCFLFIFQFISHFLSLNHFVLHIIY